MKMANTFHFGVIKKKKDKYINSNKGLSPKK